MPAACTLKQFCKTSNYMMPIYKDPKTFCIPAYQCLDNAKMYCMRGSRNFFQRGFNFYIFFLLSLFLLLLGERRSKYHYKRAIISPPAKRHLNGVSLAGRWWPNTECWLVSFVVLQEIQTNIAKIPYIFVNF